MSGRQDASSSCVSPKYPGPRPNEQLLAARKRSRKILDENLASLFDLGSTTDPAMADLRARYGFTTAQAGDGGVPGVAAAITGQLLRSGMTKAITIAMLPGLDTHGVEWATAQPTRQKLGWDALGALLDDLREDDPDMARTTVIMHSEFARTPRGDHHQPVTGRTGAQASLRAEVVGCLRREKPRSEEVRMPVPQTDTGGGVEKTKANGRTLVKELGNMHA